MYDKDRSASVEIPDSTAEKGRKKMPVKLGIFERSQDRADLGSYSRPER